MRYSVRGAVRQYRSTKLGIEQRVIWFDYFFNQRLLNKKTDSGDHKPAPINNMKPLQHQSPCVPEWSMRNRATCFIHMDHHRETSYTLVFVWIWRTHCTKRTRSRGGEMAECTMGVATAPRLQTFMCTSPFFDALAGTRHLDRGNSVPPVGLKSAFTARPLHLSTCPSTSNNK